MSAPIEWTQQERPTFVDPHGSSTLEPSEPFYARAGDLIEAPCRECDGVGEITEDSMSLVGVPGGRIAVGPCLTCGESDKAGSGVVLVVLTADPVELVSCSYCGVHPENTWRWCDGGCGSDYNTMTSAGWRCVGVLAEEGK